MPTPPKLDDAARQRGLDLRRRRAELKHWMSWNGGATYYGRITTAFGKPCAQGMKVKTLLKALPGIGPAKAKSLLDKAGIAQNNTVKRCGPKQTERLFELLAERGPRY